MPIRCSLHRPREPLLYIRPSAESNKSNTLDPFLKKQNDDEQNVL